MGCAASKEITAAKSGSKISKKRGSWFKCMFIPIVDGLLLHKKRSKAAIEQKESVKTLADALEEETAEFLKAAAEEAEKEEEEEETEPEVINVRELMKGLEEEEEDAERIPPQTAETPESRADHNAEGPLESSSDESLVSTDQEEVSSSFCNSSPEFATCLDNTTVVSPRSPLCFDSPVQCPPRQKAPICKRYGRGGDALDAVQVSRNFSFNLRSSQEQASTPKVILDSSSPLLKSEAEEFKWRLIVKQQEPDHVSASGPIDSSDPDIDGDLLSTFETMLEQISSDDWGSSTRTSIESPGSSSDAESHNAPDLNSKPQEVTLYFAANDQQCSTITSILMNHGIPVETKDISIDPAHREELARLIDCCVQVPALFIDGRYIGGAEQLLELNRKDELRRVLDGARCVCRGCGGICLVPCLDCNGSRRFLAENGELEQCNECTENGMVKCPLCSTC